MQCAEGHLRHNCHLCPEGSCTRLQVTPVDAAADPVTTGHITAARPSAVRGVSRRVLVASVASSAVLALVAERLVS